MDEECIRVISVCMPYFNNEQMAGDRQEMLYKSLDAYEFLYPHLDIEIVICDDGSPIPVDAPTARVIRLPRKDHALNPCVPINRAIAESSGNIIVLTNPEIEHRTPVFDSMLKALVHKDDYVTASCINPDGRWLAHSSIDPKGTSLRAPIPPGSQFHFCAMFHRSLWDKTGGFDEALRYGQAFDDNDWLWKLDSVNARFKHLDDQVVFHNPTGTKWPAGGWQKNAQIVIDKWSDRWAEVFHD